MTIPDNQADSKPKANSTKKAARKKDLSAALVKNIQRRKAASKKTNDA